LHNAVVQLSVLLATAILHSAVVQLSVLLAAAILYTAVVQLISDFVLWFEEY